MKLLVDAQLPPVLAAWLREAGHDASAVREVGLREAKDELVWRFAENLGYVILTKDEDFALRVQAIPSGPRVVWLRVGNTSNAALKAWFMPRLGEVVELLERGARIVEVR